MTPQEFTVKVIILKSNIAKAKANARRQKRRLSSMKPIAVRPEFWEQVAREYKGELRKTINNFIQ